MKRIDYKILLTIFVLLLGCISCDDFLEKAPDSNLDEEKVFTIFTNAEKYHAEIYGSVKQRFNVVGSYQPVPLATASDEADAPRGYHGTLGLTNGAYDGVDADIYGYYEGIRRANTFLLKQDVIPFPSESRKEQMLGEVYFLRAFFYSELIKRFGGMPILDETTGILKPGDNLSKARNSYKECVTFILSDLQKAIAYLPLSVGETSYGRATRGAAMALKARVLLYAASPLWQREMGENLWAEAAQAAKDVIDLTEDGEKVYELFDRGNGANDYEQLFFTRREGGNKEIIFSKHDYAQGFSSNQIKIWAPSGGQLGGDGAVCPTQNFVDLFEMSDGSKFDWNNPAHAANPFNNRDPRFYKIILYNGVAWQGETIDVTYDENKDKSGAHRKDKSDYTRTGYYVRKYLPETVKNLGSNTSYHEWIFFRLAEMYLDYAEALNETLAQPSEEVYKAVNTVRNRSKVVDLPKGLSKEEMRARIWNERAIELSFEEHRWWDARRWKVADQWFGGPMYELEIRKNGSSFTYDKKVFYTRIYLPHMNLYPIPISEMQKNPLYVQNPGW